MLIKIVDSIDLNEAYAYLNGADAGAVNFFIGTVRDHSKGKKVVKLDFEAYDGMALHQMELIASEAKNKWPLLNVVILHVKGSKIPGEPVVLIGVSSAHRDASFEACRFLIDELKKSVPIWKKEYYQDSSVWVNSHP